MKAYNLEDENERSLFMNDDSKTVTVPGSDKTVLYHQTKKIGVMVSRLGTSRAIAFGAYNFALNELNNNSTKINNR